jgi:hypothetical protein
MAKSRGKPQPDDKALLAELDRRLASLQEGKGDWSEFWRWWDATFGIKGKGILQDFLRQRELARGWNAERKRPKSS